MHCSAISCSCCRGAPRQRPSLEGLMPSCCHTWWGGGGCPCSIPLLPSPGSPGAHKSHREIFIVKSMCSVIKTFCY